MGETYEDDVMTQVHDSAGAIILEEEIYEWTAVY